MTYVDMERSLSNQVPRLFTSDDEICDSPTEIPSMCIYDSCCLVLIIWNSVF